KEWHPTKNLPLLPTEVGTGVARSVWWACSKGHEWEARIFRRNRGDGCGSCAGNITTTGENDLATVNPELASEWHPTKNGTDTPANTAAQASKKAWWLGKCGHDWDAFVSSR